MTNYSIKVLVCLSFTCFQVIIALVYKWSQTHGNYTYSTISVITIAEFIKLAFSLYISGYLTTHSIKNFKIEVLFEHISFVLQTFLVASIYCINNQIGFILYQYIDIVTISLFKAFVSLEIAILSCLTFRRRINSLQWCSIFLQVIGLVIVQYDVCNRRTLLEIKFYLILILSCTFSAISTVWNEYLLKNYSVDLHLQNILLYFFGAVMNSITFLAFHNRFEYYSKDFFEGYSLWTMGVIVCNSMLGIMMTFVYKYGDAVIKTFGSALASAVMIFLNWTLFGVDQNVMIFLGATVISISSYIYFAASSLALIPDVEDMHQTVNAISSKSKILSTMAHDISRRLSPYRRCLLVETCLIIIIVIVVSIIFYLM